MAIHTLIAASTRVASALSAAGLALLLAGCASTGSPVRVDQADDFNAGRCQTFAWHSPSDDAASFTEQRVRSQVMSALKAKGYAEATENPSCRISYALATREVPRSGPGVGVGVGGGSRGVGGGIGVTLPLGRKDSQAGTFALDVIDAARNAQIWSGSIESTFATAELSEDEVTRIVDTVLAKFPDRQTDGSGGS